MRPDNLLGNLGIENGDRFDALDDRPLETDEEAREAFSQAKTKRRFTLKIHRKDAATTLVFNVK